MNFFVDTPTFMKEYIHGNIVHLFQVSGYLSLRGKRIQLGKNMQRVLIFMYNNLF